VLLELVRFRLPGAFVRLSWPSIGIGMVSIMMDAPRVSFVAMRSTGDLVLVLSEARSCSGQEEKGSQFSVEYEGVGEKHSPILSTP